MRLASTSKKPPQFGDAGFQVLILFAQLLQGICIKHAFQSPVEILLLLSGGVAYHKVSAVAQPAWFDTPAGGHYNSAVSMVYYLHKQFPHNEKSNA